MMHVLLETWPSPRETGRSCSGVMTASRASGEMCADSRGSGMSTHSSRHHGCGARWPTGYMLLPRVGGVSRCGALGPVVGPGCTVNMSAHPNGVARLAAAPPPLLSAQQNPPEQGRRARAPPLPPRHESLHLTCLLQGSVAGPTPPLRFGLRGRIPPDRCRRPRLPPPNPPPTSQPAAPPSTPPGSRRHSSPRATTDPPTAHAHALQRIPHTAYRPAAAHAHAPRLAP